MYTIFEWSRFFGHTVQMLASICCWCHRKSIWLWYRRATDGNLKVNLRNHPKSPMQIFVKQFVFTFSAVSWSIECYDTSPPADTFLSNPAKSFLRKSRRIYIAFSCILPFLHPLTLALSWKIASWIERILLKMPIWNRVQ